MPERTVRVEKVTKDDVDVYVLHLEGSPNDSRTGFENKLNADFLRDFNAALDEVLKDSNGGPAGLVTVGKGKHYSDGLDLSYVLGLDSDAAKIDFLKQVELLFYRVLTLPMPTVAAVNGHAFAGGMLLSLAHDYRVANEEKGFWCMSEIDIGAPLTPGFSALLNAKMSPHIASHMMISGSRLNAKEMQKHAVVWDTAKGEGAVLEAAVKLAAKLGPKAKSVMTEIKQDVWDRAAKQLLTGSAARAKY
jgi:enoyl-CoA hydratase/carnithine racemase